jgi:hypothetical protein
MSSQQLSAAWNVVLLAAAATVGFAGCGSTQSPEKRVEQALDQGGVAKHETYPLAGKVTIDGQPPSAHGKGVVILALYETSKPELTWEQRPQVLVQPDGSFAFTSYFKGDGVAPGQYVVTIAQLKSRGKRGFYGPDELQNLYNDPEVNAKKPEFSIDHKAPGKSDYQFDLKIAGVEPVKTPGAHAMKEIISVERRK